MGNLAIDSMNIIRKAREDFLAMGIVPTGLVNDAIVRSWQRSAERGIGTAGRGDTCCIPRHDLMRRRETHNTLLLRSQPVMENLYHEICGTSSMVLLADSEGVVLHSIGDPDFVDQAQKVYLKPGGIWSEKITGTNAIGTALEEQAAVHVHSSEHFIEKNRFLSCSATPIFDPRGAILGALDVSGDYRSNQRHTMALVRLSAQIIENQMFAPEFPNDIVVCFHVRPEFIGTLYEGIAVFSPDGEFIAANRSALLQLGLDRFRMSGHRLDSLFRISVSRLLEQARGQHHPVLRLPLQTGTEIFARIWPGNSTSTVSFPAAGVKPGSIVSTPATDTIRSSTPLAELELGDRRMQGLIGRALKVSGYDIPIMLEGESGTGKEMFARALHLSGPRRNAPFVPVNCAAIPEGLIESELFGYQEGAFTGARRKGHIGKIREADGGTLFLDEIGEMPLQFQARLLRVLQDRLVTPLGGTGGSRVDIAVVCATNRRLRDAVSAGTFREDLYYRLNGLLLTLPGLREREDRLPLARKILTALAGTGRHIAIAREVLNLFETHPWPGNIRQMHNVLRTAVALLGDNSEITLDDLSEEFLEQAGRQLPVSAGPAGKALIADMEARLILTTLDRTGGNIAAAARSLGIGRNTLYRKLRGIQAEPA